MRIPALAPNTSNLFKFHYFWQTHGLSKNVSELGFFEVCYNKILWCTLNEVVVRELNIREMRSILGKLDTLVEEQQELIITRNKQPIARVLPITPAKKRPSHEGLRASQQLSTISSAELIRQDRDER